MFEGLFKRRIQEVPEEEFGTKDISGNSALKKAPSSSISVEQFLLIKNLVIGAIAVVGIICITFFAVGLVDDFLIYGNGELSISEDFVSTDDVSVDEDTVVETKVEDVVEGP